MSDEPRLTRVLVALDASPLSLAALEAAAALAGRIGAELTGVYVEDVNLTRLPGHPAATSISLVGGFRRDPEHRLLDNALKVQSAAARRAFDEVAEPLGPSACFAVRQGRVEAELLAAAEQADLVLVGCSSSAIVRGARLPPLGRLGSTARAVMERAARPVLVVRHALLEVQPVAVLYDGSAASRRALVLAARLAVSAGARLDVIALATDPDAARRREQEARALIAPVAIAIDSRPITQADTSRLTVETTRRSLALLVLPDTARHLMEALPCSVVVVP